MVILSGGDLCEDYIYYGYSEEDIYNGNYIDVDNDELEIEDEHELEEEDISISRWEYRLMLLV